VRAVELLAEREMTRFTIVDGYLGDLVRQALTARFPEEWFRFVRNAAWADTTQRLLPLARRFTKPERCCCSTPISPSSPT